MRDWWYHCTQTNHGDRWVPSLRCPKNIGRTEPKTPRLCVSPWVPECFVAVLFEKPGPVWVYRTIKRYSGIPAARHVWDADLTQEHWLIPPVVLERVGSIPDGIRAALVARAVWYYRTYRRPSLKVKFAMLIEAWGTVGPLWHPKRSRTLVPKLKRILGDPEDLWLDAAIEAEAKNRREEALLCDPSQWLDC